MTKPLRILALIPARGGSKRLPGKNKRLLGDKPLICWSIQSAQGIPDICDILVSTDDHEIAEISKAAGALVPWLRPEDLATDTATSIDVALHALNWYEMEHGVVDGLLLLQPTSPFREKSNTKHGIELFTKHGQRQVVSVTPTHDHPMWAMKMQGEFLEPYMKGGGGNTRAQDLPPAYMLNGNFYLTSPQKLRECNSFLSDETIPLLIESQKESLDIDTEWDFEIALCAIK
jgi:CMP-N,N'-diacetyllegionaminic acid synthase